MSNFPVHTLESAPSKSKPTLEASIATNGFLPNLHAVMAESPELLEAYQSIAKLFMATSFNNTERTVIWQTINVENACHYCVPAHTAIANSQRVDSAVTNALRDNTPLADSRLEALRTFTLHVVRQHGNVSNNDVQTFLDAGFTRQNIFEVLVGLSQKVLSNYTNHFAQTPVDDAFKPFAWSPDLAQTS